MTETVGPTELKYLLSSSLQEKLANPDVDKTRAVKEHKGRADLPGCDFCPRHL